MDVVRIKWPARWVAYAYILANSTLSSSSSCCDCLSFSSIPLILTILIKIGFLTGSPNG